MYICIFMHNIINEGMRLWAVTPIGSNRVVSKDIHYKEFIIPKGATVGLFVWLFFFTYALLAVV
jgi:cytochrome P450